MIQPVIEYINTKVGELKGFDAKRIKGLCEKVTDGDMSYPGIYGGNDTIDFITSNDFKNGCAWHQKSGDFTLDVIDGFGRSNLFQYTQPMKLYAINRRDLITDSPYSADEMALNILTQIHSKNLPNIASLLTLSRAQVLTGGYGTDKDELDQIFVGVPLENIKRYDVMFCSVSYNIVLIGKQSCFSQYTCEK